MAGLGNHSHAFLSGVQSGTKRILEFRKFSSGFRAPVRSNNNENPLALLLKMPLPPPLPEVTFGRMGLLVLQQDDECNSPVEDEPEYGCVDHIRTYSNWLVIFVPIPA
jgi:hypothetical protein